MKRKIEVFLFLIGIILSLFNVKSVNAEVNNFYSDKVYKIAIIDLEPYSYINEDGEAVGYYIDYFDLIGKELNLNYEYVLLNNEEVIDKLVSGEVDFSLGITMTKERGDILAFNVHPIGYEKFALYANKNIKSSNISLLSGLKLGALVSLETDWILEFFKASNINVEVVYGDNYDEIRELMDNNSVDLMIDSAYKNNNYKKIYQFTESQVYIAGNKECSLLMNDIDNAISRINNKDKDAFSDINDSYFNKEKIKNKKIIMAFNIILKNLIRLLVLIVLFPILRVISLKLYLKKLIKSKRAVIDYQPIYNFKDKKLVGFESMLKDKLKDEYLKHSFNSIGRVKGNSIICFIVLLELKRIIKEYKEIKESIKDDFYISIDIPMKQLKYDKFVNKAIELLNKSNLAPNSISIEIIGNIKTRDIKSVSENIKKLREAGFLIAIDDLGIEYSNLNMIIELDIDIIRINKTFTENVDKSIIKNEIIKFISKIGKVQDKVIILEGINEENQMEIINELDNDKLCVQGELYSKILSVEEIEKMSN